MGPMPDEKPASKGLQRECGVSNAASCAPGRKQHRAGKVASLEPSLERVLIKHAPVNIFAAEREAKDAEDASG